MPPRTRTTTKTDADPSVVEQMADDAATATAPKEFPPGAPEFKALLGVRPRSRRAEFKRCYAAIAEMNVTIKALQAEAKQHDEGSDQRYAAEIRLWAQMDELGELAEAALRLVAVAPDAFEAWVLEVSDEDLMTTFSAYQAMAQPGEASSSAS